MSALPEPSHAYLAALPPMPSLPRLLLSVATADQTDLALNLLPVLQTARQGPPRGVLLAHPAAQPRQVLGAACLTPGLGDGCGFALQVLPGWRRRGIGRRLLDGLIAQAAAWPWPRLKQQRVPDGSPAAAWLAAQGFCAGPGSQVHRVPVPAALAACRHLQNALVQMGRVPAGVAVRPLAQVPLPALAALLADDPANAGVPLSTLLDGLAQVARDPHGAQLSAVLVQGLRPVGVLLAQLQQGLPSTTHWVLAPGLPAGWPAVLLIGAYLRQAQGRRHAEATLQCREDELAPQHIARQAGGVCDQVLRSHWRAL